MAAISIISIDCFAAPPPDPLCFYCTANCTEVLLHSYCTAIALMCYCTVLKCYYTPIAVYCTTIHQYCTTFSLLLYCYCTLPLRCNVVLSHSYCCYCSIIALSLHWQCSVQTLWMRETVILINHQWMLARSLTPQL